MYVCIVSAIMSSTGVPSPPILMQPNNTDVLDVSVTLTWNEPMDIDIASYRIEYRVKVDESEWMVAIVDAPVTSHVITDLLPRATYEVRIFAISVDDVTSVAADPLSFTTGGIYVVVIIVYFISNYFVFLNTDNCCYWLYKYVYVYHIILCRLVHIFSVWTVCC